MNHPDRHITGTVFNIQRYSIHDGPGIRTTVFLKGCPMHCAWCENPESIGTEPELAFYPGRCIHCGACEKSCPNGAAKIGMEQGIDRTRCRHCGTCVKSCAGSALQMIGETLSVGEVVTRVLRDRVFFDRSGGGATVSGGEPTLQYDFLLALLSALKEERIHTVLETNGFLPWGRMKRLIGLVDLFYFDLKAIDNKLHGEFTGVGNRQILDNAKRLAHAGARIVYRLPLIPSVNTSEDSIRQMAHFLDAIDAAEIHLLPYHRLGEGKLSAIDTRQRALSIPDMKRKDAEALKHYFERSGRKVLVGGE